MTYPVSYYGCAAEDGCVGKPSLLKLLLWIMKNVRKCRAVVIQVLED